MAVPTTKIRAPRRRLTDPSRVQRGVGAPGALIPIGPVRAGAGGPAVAEISEPPHASTGRGRLGGPQSKSQRRPRASLSGLVRPLDSIPADGQAKVVRAAAAASVQRWVAWAARTAGRSARVSGRRLAVWAARRAVPSARVSGRQRAVWAARRAVPPGRGPRPVSACPSRPRHPPVLPAHRRPGPGLRLVMRWRLVTGSPSTSSAEGRLRHLPHRRR